jgi:hypothetical protein
MRDSIGTVIDTKQTYAFGQSPWKMALVVLGCIGFVVASVLMIVGVIDGRRFGLDASTVGWIGAVVFGAFLLLALWRLIDTRGPVVTISPRGLHDTRISEKMIPWDAVLGVSIWQMSNQKIIVVAVTPDAEQSIGLTRMAKWTRGANKSLGADGLCINPGIKAKPDDLLRLIIAYGEARAGISPNDGPSN